MNIFQSTFQTPKKKVLPVPTYSSIGAPRSMMINNKSTSITGSVKAPQSYVSPVTAPKPPPVTKLTPPAPAPAPQQSFEQDYRNYLAQSQGRKDALASSQEEEARRQAEENYNLNKQNLEGSQKNLDALMSGFRQRAAAGQARLDAQAAQNKQRATVASGDTQRELAIARRQQLGDIEKRYAALGTIDSMGTGSFQAANENKESDFLRMTAQNKQSLENNLADIDNKLFDAKSQAEERIATEESKYNDALLEINRLMAGNEVEKQQAIRAATQLLAQRKGEITDEYEGLRMQYEKEKYDKQSALAASRAEQDKIASIFENASPEFQKTGRPMTAQDQFLVFKYPKEAEAYQKLLATSGGQSNEKAKLISLVNDISSDPGLNRITGLQGAIPLIPGSKEQLVKGQIEQLKALLSLQNRQMLKGQGAISDSEMGILERASSLLNQNLSADQTRQVLAQLKAELSSGQPTSINANQGTIQSPNSQSDPLGLFN